MKSFAKTGAVVGLVLLGAALAGASIYIAEVDDAPGAAVFGFLLMAALWTGAVRMARNKE